MCFRPSFSLREEVRGDATASSSAGVECHQSLQLSDVSNETWLMTDPQNVRVGAHNPSSCLTLPRRLVTVAAGDEKRREARAAQLVDQTLATPLPQQPSDEGKIARQACNAECIDSIHC